uniref:Uncharacterized protein n=1 Tax=Acrobeloides nanus TaxID=290746 RepID=A0A914EJT2_9BILA
MGQCSGDGEICPSEYSNTPRFVLTISPPLDWTTPANSDSSFTNIDAGTVPVTLITQGTGANLDEATSNAQQDIQDALEKAIRNVNPTYNSNDLSIDSSGITGFSINAFTSPYSVTQINSVTAPAGIVEIGAVTKQCNKTCTGTGGVTMATLPPGQVDVTTYCTLPFPDGSLACEVLSQYSAYIQEITFTIKTGPLMSGTQWREVSDNLFKILNSRQDVIFSKDIEVYPK